MLGPSRRSIATVVLALIAAVVVGCLGLASASTTDVRVYDAATGEPYVSGPARLTPSATGRSGVETLLGLASRVYDDPSHLARAPARLGGYRLAPRAEGSAFHQTTDQAVSSIMRSGVRPGSDATLTRGLSPLQAHIELALNPAGGARNAVLQSHHSGHTLVTDLPEPDDTR
jgi:hypothetical protein